MVSGRVSCTDCPMSRRAVLGSTAVGLTALAGCLGGEDAPDPVDIEDGWACDQCSMIIARHPGPVGQSYYPEDTPPELEDRDDGHARFCSTRCLYNFTFEQDERGFEPAGSYATDYSVVEYELDVDGQRAVIDPPQHVNLDTESFSPVGDLQFVVGSDFEGAMGGTLIGFGEESDAESFAEEHGGDRFEHGEITPELIASL